MTPLTSGMRPPRPVTPQSILTARLQQLSRRLESLGGVDPDLTAELRRICEFAGGLDPYLSRCTTPESPALRALAERTQAEDWDRRGGGGMAQLEAEMLSGHVEGQALKFLVHLARAERVLDIGMFTGYSALAMAEALPADGEVVACEVDADVAQFARRCLAQSPSGNKVSVRVGPALATLQQLASDGDTFDFVFIDADKTGYVDYLNALLDGDLLTPHGVICADNTLLQGQPYSSAESTRNGRAIAAFNQTVRDDPRLEQVLLPLRDGLTLIRRV